MASRPGPHVGTPEPAIVLTRSQPLPDVSVCRSAAAALLPHRRPYAQAHPRVPTTLLPPAGRANSCCTPPVARGRPVSRYEKSSWTRTIADAGTFVRSSTSENGKRRRHRDNGPGHTPRHRAPVANFARRSTAARRRQQKLEQWTEDGQRSARVAPQRRLRSVSLIEMPPMTTPSPRFDLVVDRRKRVP